MRYQLIRDKQLKNFNEDDLEVCDTKEEIDNFSVKEIMNLLNELKESDYQDRDVFIDIYALLKNLLLNNKIDYYKLNMDGLKKIKTKGSFTKYLLKIR